MEPIRIKLGYIAILAVLFAGCGGRESFLEIDVTSGASFPSITITDGSSTHSIPSIFQEGNLLLDRRDDDSGLTSRSSWSDAELHNCMLAWKNSAYAATSTKWSAYLLVVTGVSARGFPLYIYDMTHSGVAYMAQEHASGGTTDNIQAVLQSLKDFFQQGMTILDGEDKTARFHFLGKLKDHVESGKQQVERCASLSQEIQNLLTEAGSLTGTVGTFIDGFQTVRSGLHTMSETCEGAVQNIEAASAAIQEKLEEAKKKLADMKAGTADAGYACQEVIGLLDEAADSAFNLLMELQFQDLLRQQVSAVATILQESQQRITDSLERLNGEVIAVKSSEETFATTDETVLDQQKAQDDIDALINAHKS